MRRFGADRTGWRRPGDFCGRHASGEPVAGSHWKSIVLAPAAAAEAQGSGWSDVLVKDDLFGRARYLVARRSKSL